MILKTGMDLAVGPFMGDPLPTMGQSIPKTLTIQKITQTCWAKGPNAHLSDHSQVAQFTPPPPPGHA